MKWKMSSSRHFEMEYMGYHVDLYPFDGVYPTWFIVKDGIQVAHVYTYPPVTTDCNKELAAKVQVERILTKLIFENSKTLELI